MEKNGKYRIWSESELNYLREHYPIEPMCDIAEYLGISAYCVRTKATELGLKRAEGWSHVQYMARYVKHYKDERYKNYNRVA